MPIRDCRVVAIEGTHASGKTTLVHALVSHYRERGVHVTCTGEPARTSPFMEEIVLHGKGTFDVVAELDTLGAQITTQLRTARHHALLITDKTLVNVVAYARLLLPPENTPVVQAMLHLCQATVGLYDAVFYATDTFNPRQAGDQFRNKVADQQAQVDMALRDTAEQAGLTLTDIPRRLSTAERVAWISARLDEMDLETALA
jgi:nicotinamide riboside kinase